MGGGGEDLMKPDLFNMLYQLDSSFYALLMKKIKT